MARRGSKTPSSSKGPIRKKLETQEDSSLLAPPIVLKKRNVTGYHKWTEDEERFILDFAKKCLQAGQEFEKPTAPNYYNNMLQMKSLPRSLKGLTADKIIQHMKTLRTQYTTAINWRKNTGQGILEADKENGVKTVEDYLLTLCKYYTEINELIGTKPQYNPPYQHDSELVSEPENVQDVIQIESIDDIENVPIDHTPETKRRVMSSFTNLPVKRKKVDTIKSAASALESAMNSRAIIEEQRLEFDRECRAEELKSKLEDRQDERKLRESQLSFEREKWLWKSEAKKVEADRRFELEKVRIEHNAKLEALRVEKEFEIEKLKLTSNNL